MALFHSWLEAARLGADIQRVMTLRMMRIAAGGAIGRREAQLMVSEKIAAFGEAQVAMATALAAGHSLDIAHKRAMTPYRRRVGANRRRLGK